MEEIKLKFPVPPGFSALLESLAREVLRFQPDDIYAFSALYFDVLLHLRAENPSVDILANKDLYESLKRHLAELAKIHNLRVREGVVPETNGNPNGKEIAVAASKIQAGVRGFLTRKHLEMEGKPVRHPQSHHSQPSPHDDSDKENNSAATKIQAGVRGFLTRKRLEHQGKLPHPHGSRKPSKKGRKSPQKQPHPDEHEQRAGSPDIAATKIQAGVRGFLVRKRIAKQKSAATKIEAEFRSHLARQEFLREKQAAIKIQSTFRGYKTRKVVQPKLMKKITPVGAD